MAGSTAGPTAGLVAGSAAGTVAGVSVGPAGELVAGVAVGSAGEPVAGAVAGSAGEAVAADFHAPRSLPAAEGFSPVAAEALRHACVRAAGRADGAAARGVDLLVALVADPGARAVEVLGRAGVDVRAVRAGLPAVGPPSSR
ncbi:hypothetical protein [Streptomyces sp. NPDC003247]|uniref:hypothetical protein n=1 Tax=Streptomyces sp. NPDC003247 TaxID=3364677 RepID=UPI0036A1E7EB